MALTQDEYNSTVKDRLFKDTRLIKIASHIVEEVGQFEKRYISPNGGFNSNADAKQKRIAENLYKMVPEPKLLSLKYIELYITETDVDEWIGRVRTDPREVATDTIQEILESGVTESKDDPDWIYRKAFLQKTKTDPVLANYLKGKNISETKLRSALENADQYSDHYRGQAKQYADHVLRYDYIRARNAHLKKVRTLQGALENTRTRKTHAIIVNPNQSKSLGSGNRARRTLNFNSR